MKITLTSALFLLLAITANAQVTDTLGYSNFMIGTEVMYTSPNGGYAFGNNGYGDKVKAQTYTHESSFVLRSVLFKFGDVVFESGDSTSVIRVNIYDNHGFGITSFGSSDSIAPDSVLGFVDIPVYDLFDDGSLTNVEFDSDTIVIFSKFSVGIDLTHLANGDTVGLLSTTDGDAMGSINAWELTANNSWFTVEESAFSWGLDVDFAIFPVIDENDPARVIEQTLPEISLFPNPCANVLMVHGIECIDCQILVYDPVGRLVAMQQFEGGSKPIDVSGLHSGIYILTVSDGFISTSNQFIKL